MLVPPTASGLASGIGCLLTEGPIRSRAMAGAIALRRSYGIEEYVRGVARAYEYVGGAKAAECDVEEATDADPRRERQGARRVGSGAEGEWTRGFGAQVELAG